ncbi:hypothetical protein [Mesobacillus foraminis]|nr:hypothetical protein [Mesobacillus foraminis]
MKTKLSEIWEENRHHNKAWHLPSLSRASKADKNETQKCKR